MINRKWLIVSVFLPFYGTLINAILLYRVCFVKRQLPLKKWWVSMVISTCAFLASILVCLLLFKAIEGIFSLDVNAVVKLAISFVISGIVMNLAFVIYYLKSVSKGQSDGK